jgi:hypothetical protein
MKPMSRQARGAEHAHGARALVGSRGPARDTGDGDGALLPSVADASRQQWEVERDVHGSRSDGDSSALLGPSHPGERLPPTAVALRPVSAYG